MATRIPDLIFYCPDCPLCNEETNTDGDSFDCENCNLWWAKDGTEGERANSDLPECGVELSPWPDEERLTSLRSARYRCLLDEGHELPHRGVRIDQPDREDDTYDWDDIDEAAAAQA